MIGRTMIDRNSILNPWTDDDEREHFPTLIEWWCAEAFFKSVEDNKKWNLKVTFNEWFNKPKIGYISNMTLFDQVNNKHFIHYSRSDSVKLKSAKDSFNVSYDNSFMKGGFPNYEMHFSDPENDIEIDLKYLAESYPRWIAQDITNGWLPMGLGFFRYGFIPKNQLTGTMKIKDKTFTIEGTGYFEHVWGDFLYENPLTNASGLAKTIVTYAKLFGWWIRNHTIRIPSSITFSTENNPFGYDWVWALFDNGWTLFYGNLMFWIMGGPAMGSLIFSKDGKTYTEFCDITFQYKKTKYANEYDFYYPLELEITAKKGKEKLHLTFKMTNEPREYVRQFPHSKAHWIGLAVCEGPGIVEGYYSNGVETIKLSGICKIEPQRQISVIGHNKLKINFFLPPKGVGISMDFESHFFRKKITKKLQLAPSPKIKLHFERIDGLRIHSNKF